MQISTHYLGGGRHVSAWPGLPRRWEIDIGVLVLFRQHGRLIRSKVALLQSKRLYPDELEWDEDSPLDYMTGFGRLMRRDDDWADVVAPRTFSFTPGRPRTTSPCTTCFAIPGRSHTRSRFPSRRATR